MWREERVMDGCKKVEWRSDEGEKGMKVMEGGVGEVMKRRGRER